MKYWCTILLLGSVTLYLQGQDGIVTHNAFTAQTLVKDIFASGACDNIDLIAPIGHPDGLGYFENGTSAIGLDKGIILATGPTWHAAGPNNATDTSGDLPGGGGDSNLARLASGQVLDAVGLEFDFIPLDSFVRFRYVFASEEYCEFVGSEYNDVFGFFVSGPCIAGPFPNQAENVALIPGTTDFVAINSVNFDRNPAYYIHNERSQDQEHCGLTSINTPHLQQLEYDGFTTVLTAELKLEPCQTYHIRLVVGDVADAFFDSAVFLEAGSFNLGGKISVEALGNTAGPGQLFEGCEDAFFRFSRTTDSPLDHPLTVNYYLSSASTATAGVDFEVFPDQVTIPAGATYVDLPVHSWPDTLVEEAELIRLVLDIPCACYADSADLVLVPAPALEVEIVDVFACPGATANLRALPSGGAPPYGFTWSDGGQQVNQVVIARPDEWHTLTVTDACGQEATATETVQLSTPPMAVLSGEAEACAADTAWLPLVLTGIPPFQLSYRINEGDVEELMLADTLAFPAWRTGQYELLAVKDAACAGLASGMGQVRVSEISARGTLQLIRCAGGQDGSISVEVEQPASAYQFFWLHNGSDSSSLDSLPAGNYEVVVTDTLGCQQLFSWLLADPAPLQRPQVDCAALLARQVMTTTLGGTPPYRYSIDNQQWWTGDEWLPALEGGVAYTLQIRDAQDCLATFSWQQPVAYPQGMANLSGTQEVLLGIAAPIDVTYNLSPDLLAFINWQPATQLSCADCLFPAITGLQSGVLTLELTDAFGCREEQSLQLRVSDDLAVFLPTAFSPNGDDHNDVWHIYGNAAQIARIEQLQIFDRWGNALFSATDWPINSERHGWDGTARGQPLDPGVYVYWITFRLTNGEIRTRGGDIMLVR